MSHVDEGQLHAYLDGAFPPGSAEHEHIDTHLALCCDCRVRLESARVLKDRSIDVLREARAGLAGAPPADFANVVARHAVLRRQTAAAAEPEGEPRLAAVIGRPPLRRRVVPIAWAASVALALAAGWLGRELVFSGDDPLADTGNAALANGESLPGGTAAVPAAASNPSALQPIERPAPPLDPPGSGTRVANRAAADGEPTDGRLQRNRPAMAAAEAAPQSPRETLQSQVERTSNGAAESLAQQSGAATSPRAAEPAVVAIAPVASAGQSEAPTPTTPERGRSAVDGVGARTGIDITVSASAQRSTQSFVESSRPSGSLQFSSEQGLGFSFGRASGRHGYAEAPPPSARAAATWRRATIDEAVRRFGGPVLHFRDLVVHGIWIVEEGSLWSVRVVQSTEGGVELTLVQWRDTVRRNAVGAAPAAPALLRTSARADGTHTAIFSLQDGSRLSVAARMPIEQIIELAPALEPMDE